MNVRIALTGREALSLFRAQLASTVLLDLNDFPDMSGIEILKQIRVESKTAKILIVSNNPLNPPS